MRGNTPPGPRALRSKRPLRASGTSSSALLPLVGTEPPQNAQNIDFLGRGVVAIVEFGLKALELQSLRVSPEKRVES